MSKPERCPAIEDKVVRGNRTKTNERYRVRISESLAKQLEALGEPAFPGTYPQWRERVNKAIKDAGVETTPHGFRHYRITEWLSAGVRVDDVRSWWAHRLTKSAKPTVIGLKKQKTAWIKSSVRRGWLWGWTRMGMRLPNEHVALRRILLQVYITVLVLG